MLQLKFLLSFLAAATLTSAAPCNHTNTGTTASAVKAAKAVYFITNEAKNAVIALKVNADGTLSEGSTTLTGGQGASGIDGAKNSTAAPDALFSQSAVKADGKVITPPDPFPPQSPPLTNFLQKTDARCSKRRLQHRLALQDLRQVGNNANLHRRPGIQLRRLPQHRHPLDQEIARVRGQLGRQSRRGLLPHLQSRSRPALAIPARHL